MDWHLIFQSTSTSCSSQQFILQVIAAPRSYFYKVVQMAILYHCKLAVSSLLHSTKKPVTTMLTYPWKCTVLHCDHLGNTWKPLVLMT